VAERWLENRQIGALQPPACWRSGFSKSLDAFFGERDLKNSKAVEGNANSSLVGKTLEIVGI